MKKLVILSLVFCTSCILSIQRGVHSYFNFWEIAPNANLQIKVQKKELIDFYILNESQKSELLVTIGNSKNIVLPQDSLKINRIGPGTIHIKNQGNSPTLARVRLDKVTRKIKINEDSLLQ